MTPQPARARLLVTRKVLHHATGGKFYQAGIEVRFPDGSRTYKWMHRMQRSMSQAVQYGGRVIERHAALRQAETKPPRLLFRAWNLLSRLRPWLPPVLTKRLEQSLLNLGKRWHDRKEAQRQRRYGKGDGTT